MVTAPEPFFNQDVRVNEQTEVEENSKGTISVDDTVIEKNLGTNFANPIADDVPRILEETTNSSVPDNDNNTAEDDAVIKTNDEENVQLEGIKVWTEDRATVNVNSVAANTINHVVFGTVLDVKMGNQDPIGNDANVQIDMEKALEEIADMA